MPITELQRTQRKTHLGASDAAAVLNLSPWRSAYDVYLEKTADLAELEPTPAMDFGNKLENAVIDMAAERIGCRIKRNQRRVARNGVMAANLDAITEDGTPLEVKTSSDPREWGQEDEGIEGVPMQYAVQALHQAICVEAPTAYLGVFLMGFRPELRVYRLDLDGEVAAGLEDRLCGWWEAHVKAGKPPTVGEPPSLDTLRRVKRTPGVVAPLPSEVFNLWRAADERAKAAAKESDALKARIVAALGTAEEGECEAGRVTFYQQTRKSYTVAESSYRVLRVAKNGGAA